MLCVFSRSGATHAVLQWCSLKGYGQNLKKRAFGSERWWPTSLVGSAPSAPFTIQILRYQLIDGSKLWPLGLSYLWATPLVFVALQFQNARGLEAIELTSRKHLFFIIHFVVFRHPPLWIAGSVATHSLLLHLHAGLHGCR